MLPTFVVVFMVALAVSMAIIPVMIRLAPHIGMIDKPDPRKVHVVPIPRAGGIGIVLGALLPMAIWLPLTDTLLAFYVGSLVLLAFGVWDDIAELGHYVKFIGQFIAAILVVYFGGVVVESFPFMGLEPLSPMIGKPFTVIALVGMINAINHSDGLDGLAGGESLMSLAGMLYLATQASGTEATVLAVAVMGGVFGFLRFNSHPARVFMGDGGSQFLGFSLGVLAVLLTQQVNTALSPALPLLLLGLPIADILMVFWKRARAGGSWFKATKNHVHHRLLELGFHHYESVTIIYTVQALMVLAAVAMPYVADAALVAIYLALCLLVFVFLERAERRSWRVHAAVGVAGGVMRNVQYLCETPLTRNAPAVFVTLAVSIFMLIGAFGIQRVPADMTLVAAVLAVALLVRLVLGYRVWFLMLRLLVFTAVALVVYLVNTYPQSWYAALDTTGYVFFAALALALAIGIRLAERDSFRVTPLDYLVVLIVVALAMLPEKDLAATGMLGMALQAIVLFYGAELAMRKMRNRWNLFTGATLFSLGVIAVRGLWI
ncbi:MAG: undecaprenyl/decaprenyl-phosphate alpha-N-acetylglucosaminyl 1-phosphate transferase [Gammaproteobacteria bacterium]|nr:undecaprenyl/decaprenyl-phosphate alpha-N-acetylglucosaminyl 1-phosphate transferase [Gammaproteobacteria bacterium]